MRAVQLTLEQVHLQLHHHRLNSIPARFGCLPLQVKVVNSPTAFIRHVASLSSECVNQSIHSICHHDLIRQAQA